MNTSPNAAQTDPSIIVDKKSGKQFCIFRYFGHKVIQDVETGWINAGKFVKKDWEDRRKKHKNERF